MNGAPKQDGVSVKDCKIIGSNAPAAAMSQQEKISRKPEQTRTLCIRSASGATTEKTVGCDWAAYGLFDICKIHVDGQPVFEFAD